MLPENSNTSIYHADGKLRVCPKCNEPLAFYSFRYFASHGIDGQNQNVATLLNGYQCKQCGMICANRGDLNDLITTYVQDT